MNEWLTFKIKDGCHSRWLHEHVNNATMIWKFQSKFWKSRQKKKILKLIEIQSCWSLVSTTEKESKSFTHTFKPKKKIF